MAINDYLHTDDNALINLSVDGDSRAFGELVRRYEEMVARTVKNMLGDTQVAQDVGQDTFIRLPRSINEFRGESKLSTYIQRIAINLSLNELKRNKRLVTMFFRSERDDDSELVLPDTAYSAEESDDLREILSGAIARLQADYRSVVVLRLVHGYSSKETAEILDLPVGTVLSRLSRAREQLQLELKKLSF